MSLVIKKIQLYMRTFCTHTGAEKIHSGAAQCYKVEAMLLAVTGLWGLPRGGTGGRRNTKGWHPPPTPKPEPVPSTQTSRRVLRT